MFLKIEPTTELIDKIFEKCEFLNELKISRREVYRIICEWESIKKKEVENFHKSVEEFGKAMGAYSSLCSLKNTEWYYDNKKQKIAENTFNKQAEIFLHNLAIAHLQKDGNGKIPPEMVDFVNGCFTNGIELEIKEK